MSSREKTVLLVNRFYGGESTPTGRMLQDVAEALVSEGHVVEVLTSSAHYPRPGRLDDLPRGRGVRRIRTPTRGRLLPWLFFYMQAIVRIPLMRWDCCVLLSDPPMLHLIALVVPGRRKIFHWSMDVYPDAFVAASILKTGGVLDRLLRSLTRIAFRRFDGVIALGSRQRERLEKLGARDPFIVEPWDRRPLRKVTRSENHFLNRYRLQDKKLAVYAGNLGAAHSHEEILGAAELLSRNPLSPWMFCFAIRGARKRDLERDAAGLSNVLILDYVQDDHTSDLLWAADVHLITMRAGWEGIVVPSKLYGILKTESPVLFIGPLHSDTAESVRTIPGSACLPPGCIPADFVQALERLASQRIFSARHHEARGPELIASFLSAEVKS